MEDSEGEYSKLNEVSFDSEDQASVSDNEDSELDLRYVREDSSQFLNESKNVFNHYEGSDNQSFENDRSSETREIMVWFSDKSSESDILELKNCSNSSDGNESVSVKQLHKNNIYDEEHTDKGSAFSIAGSNTENKLQLLDSEDQCSDREEEPDMFLELDSADKNGSDSEWRSLITCSSDCEVDLSIPELHESGSDCDNINLDDSLINYSPNDIRESGSDSEHHEANNSDLDEDSLQGSDCNVVDFAEEHSYQSVNNSEAEFDELEEDYSYNWPAYAEPSDESNMSSWESGSNISVESELLTPEFESKPKVLKADASTSCTELNANYSQMNNIFGILNRDRKENTLCDLVIKVEERSFSVHKGILKAQSPYFEMMFTGPFVEAHADIITVNGLSANTFEILLEYLYGTTVQSILNSDNLCDVIMAADMLCIQPLVSHCKIFLVENWKSIEILDCYRLAKHLSMKSFINDILGEIMTCKLEEVSSEMLKQLFFDLKSNSKFDIEMLKVLYYLIEQTPKLCLALAEELLPYIVLEKIPEQYIGRFLSDLKKITTRETVISLNIIIENITRIGRKKILRLNLQVLGLEEVRSKMRVQQFDFRLWKWIDCNIYYLLASKLTEADPLVDKRGLASFKKYFGQDAKNKLNLMETEVLDSIPQYVLESLEDYFLLDVTMVSEEEFFCLSLEEFPGGWSYIVLNRVQNLDCTESMTDKFRVERVCVLPHFCNAVFLKRKEAIRSLLTVIDINERM